MLFLYFFFSIRPKRESLRGFAEFANTISPEELKFMEFLKLKNFEGKFWSRSKKFYYIWLLLSCVLAREDLEKFLVDAKTLIRYLKMVKFWGKFVIILRLRNAVL